MLFSRRTVTLRITAPEGNGAQAFEALVIFSRSRLGVERIRAETPFVRTLPDAAVTIVATSADAAVPLEVSYEVTRRGRSVMAGRSWWPIAVLERRRRHIVAAGLDGPFGEDAGRPALRAI